MSDVRAIRSRSGQVAALVVLLLGLSACSGVRTPAAGSSGSTLAPAVNGGVAPAVSVSASPSATTSELPVSPAVQVLRPPRGYSWVASPGSTAVQVAVLPGGAASLLWMDPTRLRFRLIPGLRYPEGSPATTADRTPASWVPSMLAAFDSGYKLSDHVGGYFYHGRTVVPLRAGLAAMALHADGSLDVGVWGRDLAMTADTVAVRQNLPPLVWAGRSQASVHDGVRTWGKSNGDRPLANRSALGRRADGSLVFVMAHLVTAATLADMLVASGVEEAVMLDMNISWPTGFVYAHHGSQVVGERINSHIVRPPSTYLAPFKKDFVVVSAR